MMKNIKILGLMLMLAASQQQIKAQIDTAFWFAAGWVTPDHTWKDNYVMHVAGPAGTVVRLRQPAAIAPNRYDTTFTIPMQGVFNYTFWRDKIANSTNLAFDSLEVRPADQVLPYGLYISSTQNITCVFDYVTRAPNFLNTETMSLKGQNGMGLEFVTPFQTIYRNRTLGGDVNGDGVVTQPKQQINIVATVANTTVWITPRCNVVGHPANLTYSVYLPVPGSAYTCENIVQNTYVAGNSLSGSLVSASQPIAVTVTDDSVNDLSHGCYDLMGDQIVPIEIVGRDYIINTGQLRDNPPDASDMRESAYIVGTENFTQLTINNGGPITTTLINKGETYRRELQKSVPLTFVQSSKPVYVIHASGFGCELGEAILPPLSCAGSSLVAFTRNSAQRFALNLLCKNGAQGTFTLTNSTGTLSVPVPAASFTQVPGTGTLNGGPYWGAQLNLNSTVTLPIDSYTIANTNTNTAIREFALGVFDGDFGSGGLYHYMSSFLRRTTVTTASIAPVCAGGANTVALTGTISGAALTGSWATTGSGTIDPVYTSTLGVVSTVYTLSPLEATTLNTLSITFSLTSIGCSPKTQTVSMIVNPMPIVTVGAGTTMCKNNVSPIVLSGTVTNALGGGSWSGGNGGSFGVPGPVTTYTPSGADLAAGTITLTLTSAGPLPGCSNTSNTITASFVDPLSVNPGASTIVCTNSQSFVLNGAVTGFTNTGIWNTTGTGTFFPGNASPSATYMLSAGDLTVASIVFTLTSTNNSLCAAVSNTMQANIIAKPVVVAPSDFTVCASAGVITLTGNISGAANSGTWSTPNGTGTFSQVPLTSATYTMSQNDTLNGSVKFVLHSTGGICPSADDTVQMSILKAPVVIVNPNNQTVCENAPIALTGTVSGYTNSGIWSSSGTGSFSPNNTSLGGQYFPSQGDVSNGTVKLTLSSTNNQGCPAKSASFTAVFIEAPDAYFTFPQLGRCLGAAVPFTDASQPNGSPSLTYNWNFGEAPGSISTSSNPVYTYTDASSYLVTLTVTGANTCWDTITRRVNIYPNPTSSYSVTNACKDNVTIFRELALVPPGGGTVVAWVWQWGDGTPNLTTGLPTTTVGHVYNSASGFLSALTVSTTYGCVHTSTQNVQVNPQPDAGFGMTNNPSVVQETVYFSDFSQPSDKLSGWFWSFGDENTASGNAPTHRYEDAGIYTVKLTVTDNNGCTDTTSRTIEVRVLPQVPTAFTPNGDNNNDLLFVKGGPFSKITFRVYNNWGELLFQTNDQTVGWDGRKDGVDQPVGVYVWTLEVEMYNNRVVKKNGDVSLIR